MSEQKIEKSIYVKIGRARIPLAEKPIICNISQYEMKNSEQKQTECQPSSQQSQAEPPAELVIGGFRIPLAGKPSINEIGSYKIGGRELTDQEEVYMSVNGDEIPLGKRPIVLGFEKAKVRQ